MAENFLGNTKLVKIKKWHGRNKKMYAYLPTKMSNGEVIWLQEYFQSEYGNSVYKKSIK